MSAFIKVSLSNWRAHAMAKYGRLILDKKELFAIRGENSWAIPNAIWKNVQADKRLYIPTEEEASFATHTNVSVQPSIPAIHTKPRIAVDQLFDDLSDLVDIVISGHRPSLLVTGDSGTGKSYTVFERLNAAGFVRGEDYVIVKGKTSAYGVYRTLFSNRNRMVIYDDSDAVFDGQDTRNLLKGALDSYSRRTISWQTNSTIDVSGSEEEKEEAYATIDERLAAGDDSVKLPSEFDFKGQIIFISNRDESKIEPAIITRSMTINISLLNSEILTRIEHLMDEMQPESGELTREQKEEILEELRARSEMNPHKKMSIRDFVGAMQIRASNTPRWKQLLAYT